jgi:hypothetical protein
MTNISTIENSRQCTYGVKLRLVRLAIFAMATQQYVPFYCCRHGCRAQRHENAKMALLSSYRMFRTAPNNNNCYVL